MVSKELIKELRELHGATWEDYPDVPGGRLVMPNGAIVSLGWGFGHYCSARDGVVGLPMQAVEVAVWHPAIRPLVIDWDRDDDSDDPPRIPGELGGLLPDNDVHGWTMSDDLRGLCQYAADLAP